MFEQRRLSRTEGDVLGERHAEMDAGVRHGVTVARSENALKRSCRSLPRAT
jgi:hypothetical protein